MNKLVEKYFRALGTDINIKIILSDRKTAAEAEKDIKSLLKIYKDYEKKFSRFDPESELSNMNSRLEIWQNISPEMIEILSKCVVYNRQYPLFDPRVICHLENIGYDITFEKISQENCKKNINKKDFTKNLNKDLQVKNGMVLLGKRIDLGGVAKGFVTDKAVIFLKLNGWENFLIDSGGDLFASGFNQEGKKWLISLEGFPEKKLMLEISNQAVATSGITRRKWSKGNKKFHHLINPKNPSDFSFDTKSATVIADSVEKADVLAKIIFLLGKKNGLKKSKEDKIASLILDYMGNVSIAQETKKYILKK